jgi:hypothetical protein
VWISRELNDSSLLLDSSGMTKIQSFLIPTFSFSLTLAALICPWALAARAPPGPPLVPLLIAAALASTAAVAIVLLGAVRRRDLIRIANARAVLEGLGRRPLPAARLVAMAGWSLATLYDELAWGQTLNGCALVLRLMLRAAAALACAAGLVFAAALLAPRLLAAAGFEPGLAWLAPLTALPLWLTAELALRRRDGAAAPTHREIRDAMAGLGDRLGGASTQLGLAAMTGVEQGLDAVLPLIERKLSGALRTERPDERSDGEDLVEELQH